MIKNSLLVFSDRIVENGRITEEDVRELQRAILADGLTSRSEADLLIALDRMVSLSTASWAEFLIANIVDFAVWTSTPTGCVDRETARWLVTALGCGNGPTENAARAAFEVVREAHQVDETLLAFVLRGAKHRPRAVQGFVAREGVAA